jgi:hypothetical protein
MKIQGSPQLSLCCLLFVLPLMAKTCHRKEEQVPESLLLTRADSNLIPCRYQVPTFVQNFGLCAGIHYLPGAMGSTAISTATPSLDPAAANMLLACVAACGWGKVVLEMHSGVQRFEFSCLLSPTSNPHVPARGGKLFADQ